MLPAAGMMVAALLHLTYLLQAVGTALEEVVAILSTSLLPMATITAVETRLVVAARHLAAVVRVVVADQAVASIVVRKGELIVAS